MLAFSEIIKSRMPKKHKSGLKSQIAEKLLEIILIIFSVYIALFVEGWSERRKEHKRLLQYYSNFQTEITRDITDLESMIRDAEKHITLMKNLKTLLETNGNPDSISRNFFRMFRSTLFSNSQMISYQSMLASGDLSLIEDISVRQELIKLDMAYKGVKIQEDLYIEYITNDLPKFASKTFDFFTAKPISKKFYDSAEFRNLVVIFLGHNESRLTQYKDAIQIAKSTLARIRQELKEES